MSAAGHLSAALRAEWEDLYDPRMEYKFVLRHVLETRGQHELAEFDRIRFRVPERFGDRSLTVAAR